MSTQNSMIFQIKLENPDANFPKLPIIPLHVCQLNSGYYCKIVEDHKPPSKTKSKKSNKN